MVDCSSVPPKCLLNTFTRSMDKLTITITPEPHRVLFISTVVSIYTNMITSSQSNMTASKYADETCIIVCIGKQHDLHLIFTLMRLLSLIIAYSPLNRNNIVLSDKVKYLVW